VLSLLIGIALGALIPRAARTPEGNGPVPAATAQPEMPANDTGTLQSRITALDHENRSLKARLADENRVPTTGDLNEKVYKGKVRYIPVKFIRIYPIQDFNGRAPRLSNEMFDFLGISTKQRDAIDAALLTERQQVSQQQAALAKLTKSGTDVIEVSIPAFPEAGSEILEARKNAIVAILGADDGEFLNTKINQSNPGEKPVTLWLEHTDYGLNFSIRSQGSSWGFGFRPGTPPATAEYDVMAPYVPPGWMGGPGSAK